jgi:lipoate-protein ligase A
MTSDNSQGAQPIWRFIIHPPLSPARNMAIDEAIAISFAEHKRPQPFVSTNGMLQH